MTNNSISFTPLTRQSGAALITGLIFLVVLTMIGVTAARMSTLEERMSGNMRDRSIAMQAAELALRDAERDVSNSIGAATPRISGITDFVSACTNGLCYNGPNANSNGVDWKLTPVWTLVSWTATPSVAYGDYTGAADIAGIPSAQQPRYIIEGIRRTPPGGGEVFYYRITVRAQGANQNTVVWLQEVFRP